jgi:hypothetical protein
MKGVPLLPGSVGLSATHKALESAMAATGGTVVFPSATSFSLPLHRTTLTFVLQGLASLWLYFPGENDRWHGWHLRPKTEHENTLDNHQLCPVNHRDFVTGISGG